MDAADGTRKLNTDRADGFTNEATKEVVAPMSVWLCGGRSKMSEEVHDDL